MMKKILIVAACCFLQLGVMAQPKQDNRAAHTKIADLLQQQPAKNQAALQANMTALAELGEEGITGMAAMLSAPGKGDNTAIHYALSGYAFYVTQPGKEDLRKTAVAAYSKALGQVQDKESKAFLLAQLQQIGTDQAVTSIVPYLTDERLADPAARTLSKINSPAAQQALLAALPKLSGRNKQILVEAIGDAGIPAATSALIPLATDADKMLAKTALYALAQIADPAAGKTLENAARRANYKYDLTNATGSYVAYAQNLLAKGKTKEASLAAQDIRNQAQAPEQVHVRTAALYILNQAEGERALPMLLAAVNDKQPEYRDAAMKFASGSLGAAATAAWIKSLSKATPEGKAAVITMLGNNKVEAALPAIMPFLKSKDAPVKLAAITAAGQIGGEKSVPALLGLMKTGNAAEIAAVKSALQTIKGDEVTAQSGSLLANVPPAAQVALIDVLASRKADSRIQDVLPLTGSSDAGVRKAAMGALKDMVTAGNLPALYKLLSSAQNADDIKALQAAVIAAAPGQEKAVIAQMETETPATQERYYAILAGLGGADALKMVNTAFEKGSASQKTAAVAALNDWKDASATNSLLQIARKDAAYRNTALQGYVRLAKAVSQPEQRLLMLGNAMELNPDAALKKRILAQAEQCQTFPALIFAGRFLDDPSVQQEAAQAVMNVALADKTYSGATVRGLLEKTSSVLKGRDADYQREAIRKYLAEMPAGEGFVSMFNGKDLSGWKGLVANPIKRAQMDAATLAKEQEKADAKMREGWSVTNGVLTFNGHGDNLCTTKKYGDFEMFVDWKIEPNGDAGIYLRGTPQVQIWDTARRDVGADVGSGGLYNNQSNPSKPAVLADNTPGEWNSFRIIMKGDRVTVYLNGEQVVNNVMLENYWDRKLPIFPEEQLELQAHGTKVYYRNLYVREFERAKPYVLSEAEKKEGYRILFDGTNMHQWTGNTSGYVIENGAMVCEPKSGSGGNLYTKDEFSDFVYRFEFQLTPGANNGLGIRAPLGGDAAYKGMELQILDNDADIYKNLQVYQYHGSVYGVIPAKRGFLKPTGEWNYQQVTVKGTRIIVELNGTVILDGDIANARDNGTLDHKDHPGLKNTTGHIGFLGHGSVVSFRNIRIKDLSKEVAKKK
jgi:HEAT repeat protein